ncbi:hypothetical protein DFH06DRAFT_562360 [Mycena polygramma]|nr:hypothetical protein DFH06DRAFT_562360 [Mycena polygramma]
MSSPSNKTEECSWSDEKQARERVAELRSRGYNPAVLDIVDRALDQLHEMSQMVCRFPYGQDVAKECCDRLRYAVMDRASRAQGRSGRSQVSCSISTPPNETPSTPRYTGMDAFDRILAGRMLLEVWAKWDLGAWLRWEDTIWDLLQRLGMERIPRDLWMAGIDSIRVLELVPMDLDIDAGGTVEDVPLQSIACDMDKEDVASVWLNRIRQLASSFPFGRDIIRSVVERLEIDLGPYIAGFPGSISPAAFEKRAKIIQRRFIAEFDKSAKLRRAWSELDDIRNMIEVDTFRLGKDLARWTCVRLEKAIVKQQQYEVHSLRTASRNMAKDAFFNVSKEHKIFSHWVKQSPLSWIEKEHEIWTNLHRIEPNHNLRDRRTNAKSVDWIADVIRCAEAASEDPDSLCTESEELDKDKRKAARRLHKLAEGTGISDDLREQLISKAFSISNIEPRNTKAEGSPFESKSAVARVATAHKLFTRCLQWDDFRWVIEEYGVWSEIHRIASITKNWKGKPKLGERGSGAGQ